MKIREWIIAKKLFKTSRNRITFLIVFFILCVSIQIIIPHNQSESGDTKSLISSSSSNPAINQTISIYNEETIRNFTERSGDGTKEEPFILEHLIFEVDGYSAIWFFNISLHIIVRNCTFINSGMIEGPFDYYYYFYEKYDYLSDDRYYSELSAFELFGRMIRAGEYEFFDFILGAINIVQSKNIVFENNSFIQCPVGIFSIASDNIIHSENNFTDCEFSIIVIDSKYNEIHNNVFFSGGNAIYLANSAFNVIASNNISGSWNSYRMFFGYDDYYGDYSSATITLKNSEYNTVRDNKIETNDITGILVSHSYNNLVIYNDLSRNYDGITLNRAKSNQIYENNIFSCYNGILFYYSDFNFITNNTVNDNFYGIELTNSDSNVVSLNTINDNYYYGIYLIPARQPGPMMGTSYYGSSDDNIIHDNILYGNRIHAFYLGGFNNQKYDNDYNSKESTITIVITLISLIIIISTGFLGYKVYNQQDRKVNLTSEKERFVLVRDFLSRNLKLLLWMLILFTLFIVNANLNPFMQGTRTPSSDNNKNFIQIVTNIVIVLMSVYCIRLAKDHSKWYIETSPFLYLFFVLQTGLMVVLTIFQSFSWNIEFNINQNGWIFYAVMITHIGLIILTMFTLFKNKIIAVKEYLVVFFWIFYYFAFLIRIESLYFLLYIPLYILMFLSYGFSGIPFLGPIILVILCIACTKLKPEMKKTIVIIKSGYSKQDIYNKKSIVDNLSALILEFQGNLTISMEKLQSSLGMKKEELMTYYLWYRKYYTELKVDNTKFYANSRDSGLFFLISLHSDLRNSKSSFYLTKSKFYKKIQQFDGKFELNTENEALRDLYRIFESFNYVNSKEISKIFNIDTITVEIFIKVFNGKLFNVELRGDHIHAPSIQEIKHYLFVFNEWWES